MHAVHVKDVHSRRGDRPPVRPGPAWLTASRSPEGAWNTLEDTRSAAATGRTTRAARELLPRHLPQPQGGAAAPPRPLRQRVADVTWRQAE